MSRVLAGALCLAFLAALPATVQFTDVTTSAGIHFTHYKGARGVSTILEEAGPGVCVADFDGDGFQDIYFVNGRDMHGQAVDVKNALYRNRHDGTFTDVTEKAGVPGNAYGLGCVWGDYDNDGHPDLYLTQYGKNILYRNNGDGTFTDVTEKARVNGGDFGTMFHTGAVFFDYDRDGYLDLYVGGYVEFGPASQQTCKIGFDVQASCAPSAYKGSPAVLYHNNRDGTFTNVTKTARIFQPNGKNLSVAAADYDNDGWPDLFVANDGLDVYLYHNEHNGTFKEIALTTGISRTANGNVMAAMCMSLGDYDNDGLLDLFIANGHVYQGVEKTAPEIHYKQINSLFHNEGKGKFADVTATSGNGFVTPHLGREVAFADFDNDGYVDIVVANNGDPPSLLHNTGAASGNHFVTLKLMGTRSNRDAIGTRIKLTCGGVTQIQEINGAGSYLSQSDLRAHFGLGQCAHIDKLELAWPSGAKQTLNTLEPDRVHKLTEPR